MWRSPVSDPAATGSDTPWEATDNELMAAIVAGQESALEVLYDRFAPRVFGVALHVLGDRSRAEEVTQDVFLTAWRRSDSFDPARGSVASWLSTTARNRAIDLTRGARGLSRYEAPLPVHASAAGDVIDSVFEEMDRLAIGRALAELPSPQREAIEQAYFLGRTQREIAAAVGVPLATIKGRIRLGLQKLAAQIEFRIAVGPLTNS